MSTRMRAVSLFGLATLLVAASGCGFIHKLQAKDNLNEGVRDFKKGRYQAAQVRFERALDLDPDNANAKLFYARAVNARFDQNLTEDLGLKAVDAYDAIIKSKADDPEAVDQALAFKAKVFEQLSNIEPSKAPEYRQRHREALLLRAELPSAKDKTKAAVYYTIGQGYWAECYHTISKRYQRTNLGRVEQLSIPAEAAEKMKPLIMKAHEYLQKAIAVQPDYADAWIYEKLVYLEEIKIESNTARKKELEGKANVAQDNYKKFHEQQQAAQVGA